MCTSAVVNEVYFIHLPMKMEPIVSSETSAIRTQTPGNYPKRNNLHFYEVVHQEEEEYYSTNFAAIMIEDA